MQLLHLGTDNPDQRIADDLRLFTDYSLSLTLGLMNSIVTLFSFLGILWGLSGAFALPPFGHEVSIPAYLVWVALVYAGLGTRSEEHTSALQPLTRQLSSLFCLKKK